MHDVIEINKIKINNDIIYLCIKMFIDKLN